MPPKLRVREKVNLDWSFKHKALRSCLGMFLFVSNGTEHICNLHSASFSLLTHSPTLCCLYKGDVCIYGPLLFTVLIRKPVCCFKLFKTRMSTKRLAVTEISILSCCVTMSCTNTAVFKWLSGNKIVIKRAGVEERNKSSRTTERYSQQE